MALIAAAYAVYRQTTERPPLFAPYIGAAAGRLHEFLVIWLLLVAALALWRSMLLADPEAPLAARLSNWRHLEIALPLAGCLAALPAMLAKTQFQAWLADAQARLDFLFWPTRGVFSVGLVAFSVGGSCGLFVLLPLTRAALAGWAPFFPELAAPADYAQRRTAFISAAWRSGLAAVTLVWAIAFIVLLVTWWPTAPTDRLRVGLAFAFYGAGQVVWMELFRGRVRSLLRLRLAAAADGRPAQLQPSC
jgi:hypothetical protein